MNDLDLLRELRAEIPYPERPRLTPGRSRLLAEARRAPRGRFARGHGKVVMLTAGAAAAAVVAGVAGYGLIAGSSPAPASKAVPAVTPGPRHATLAVQVLRAASADRTGSSPWPARRRPPSARRTWRPGPRWRAMRRRPKASWSSAAAQQRHRPQACRRRSQVPVPAATQGCHHPLAGLRAGQRSQRSRYHRFLKIRYSTRSTRMPATISKL